MRSRVAAQGHRVPFHLSEVSRHSLVRARHQVLAQVAFYLHPSLTSARFFHGYQPKKPSTTTFLLGHRRRALHRGGLSLIHAVAMLQRQCCCGCCLLLGVLLCFLIFELDFTSYRSVFYLGGGGPNLRPSSATGNFILLCTKYERVGCTTQLAKLSFNHSIGCTHS